MIAMCILGGLGHLAVRRLVAGVRLEVVRNITREVGQQGWSEQDADIDGHGHTDVGACSAESFQSLLDDAEVGSVGAAEVGVPLVLGQVEDCMLRIWHGEASVDGGMMEPG